jgi:hypothetical protein
MVIPHKPASVANQQLRIRYTFNRLRGVDLCHDFPHIWEDGTIEQEAAVGDPNEVATAERKTWSIMQLTREFFQSFAEL